MSDYNAIEKQYIKEQLEEHAKYLAELFQRDISNLKLIETGTLSGKFNSVANFKEYESAGSHHLELKFTDYGRFIEIAFHKKIKTQRDIENPFKRKTKKKNTRWYSHNLFGAQNRLIGRLMYGLSEIEIQRIKEALSLNKS